MPHVATDWPPTHNGEAKHAPAAHAARVVAGFTRRDLAKRFASLGFRRGAEIGVADGRYSLELCEQIPGLDLLCVDPWRQYRENKRGGDQTQQDGNYQLAQQRLQRFDVRFVRAMSMDGVRTVPMASLDFCYVDAHHGFDWVVSDLIEWSKRVRPGGVVAGHDFYNFADAGVVEAVVAYTGAHGITDWRLTDEREPSFWWFRP